MKKTYETFKNQITETQETQEPMNPIKQTILMVEYLPPELIEKLVKGFRQLIQGKGYTKDTPLVNIGVDGFHYLMDIFHYVVVTQGMVKGITDYHLDVMIVQDVVTGERVILYNRIDDNTK